MSSGSLFVRRLAVGGFLSVAVLAVAGCHSAFIEATVRNASGSPLSLVEVDYPSASFGTQNLAAGAEYHYRFKILGEGATKVLWTDSRHQDHTVAGPALHEGDEGRLTVVVGSSTAVWDLSLTHPAH
jgi:hypothetical protein